MACSIIFCQKNMESFIKNSMKFRLLCSLFILLTCFSCDSNEEPTPQEKIKTERDIQRSFIGNWRTFNDEGDYFFISIEPDGTASSTWDSGQQGEWEVEDRSIILKWQDGWKDVLTKEGETVKKLGFKPGDDVDGDPTSEAHVERVDSIPSE